MNDKELEEVELLKKLKDPMFYLENFCSVKSKVQGIVPFKLKEAQKDLFNTVNKYDRVMILKARQLGMCGHPSMKVLTSDLRWITLRDIKEGQKIVSVDEFPEKGRGKGRKLRLAIVEKKIIVNEIAYKVKMDNGVELIFTGEHRFLSKKWNNCSTVIWKKVKNFKVGDVVRYITNTWDENLSFEDGWFSGMLDGEGSFAKKSRNGSSLNVAQVEGPVWERLKKYVEEKKYSYRIEWDKRKSGLSSKFGDKIVGKIVLSRMDELFEILGRCRPTRFIERDWWTGKDIPGKKSGIGWSTIISIEQLERQEMIDLQTSTKTYIVEGFISHNSTAMVGWIYHNTIMNPGTNSAIIGYNQSLTQELFDIVKILLRSTPDALRPTVDYNTKDQITFPKLDSKIIVLPSTVNVGRGFKLNNVLCVSGDTKVFGRNGFVKNVKDVLPGEFIVNGSGGLSKVKDVIKKKNDKRIIRTKIIGTEDLITTEDHKILTRRKNDVGTGRTLEWKKAKDITKKDYIGYPFFYIRNRFKTVNIDEIVNSNYKSRSVKHESVIDINYDFGVFCGWFLAEGSISNSTISLSINKNEVEEVLAVVKKVERYAGKVGVYLSKTSKTAIIHLYGKNFSAFLEKYFGNGCLNKTINDSCWYWGSQFGYGLIYGLLQGDGYLKNDRMIQITSVSPQLIYQTKKLFVSLRLGLPNIAHKETYRYGVKGLERYDLTMSGKGNYKTRRKLGLPLPIFDNGWARWLLKNAPTTNQGHGRWRRGTRHYWARVKDVLLEENFKNEFVYDIVLEKEPHSFLTTSGVVHNCTELSSWENAEEKMMTLEASVPITGKIVVESTPKGISNLYSRMWHSKNDYVKKKYEWFWEYTREEIEIIKRRMNSPMRFAQEYGLEFLTSGRAVFSKEIIEEIQKSIKDVGEEIIDLDEKVHTVHVEDFLRIYKEPVAGKKYVAGCLPDGEKVLTDSGIKNIENINFSDKLVDINGKNTDIKNIQRRYYEGDIVEIKPNYTSISTKFTSEHLISVLENNKIKRVCKRLGGKRYYEETVKWKKAKDITDKDIVKVPIRFTFSISNSEIISHFPNQDHIRIDRRIDPSVILKEDFWFFMGLWLAEGWTRLDKLGHNSIVMHLNGYTEHDLAKRVKVICKKLFNRSLSITHRKDRQNVFDLKISSEVIYEFIINNFGQKAKNKDIKEWIKYLPNNLKLALFEGYRTGDGCEIIMKQGLKINCVSISEKLLYDFQEILLSVGILSSVTVLREAGYHFIVKKEYYCQKTFELNISVRDSDKILKNDVKFSRERHKVYGWIKDGFVYAKIAKIKKSYFKGYVNNFETKTHSYQSPFIVTHNCDISEGVEGGDYSVVTIWDRETGEEVAMFRGHLPADRMGDKLNVWGRKYNNAFMVVEINNHGLTTIKALEKHLYPSMYYRPSKLDHGGVTFTSRQGWRTTTVTKPLMTDDFAQACREKVLLIHSRELLNEMSMYVYADNGDMTCGSGMHDDCFVKDTMILTDKGNVAIQDIKIGDLVMTRNGYRPVEFTRNRKKKVIKNIGLTGTPSHKIIIVEGKKELDSVRDYDKLHIWNTQKQKIEKLSYMEARNIIDTQNQIGVNYDRTTGDTINGKNHLLHYIGRFGLIILDQYQKVLLFIIKIMTRWTTLLKTWKRKAEVNIQKTTWMNQKEKNFRVLLLKNKEQDYMKQVQNGEKLQKELSLIEKIYLFLYSKLKGLLFVVFVKNLLSLGYTMLNIVLILVEIFTGTIELSQKRRVYNLQVYDTHEYFANNILVSNCIMSACIGLQGFKMMAPKPLTQIDYTSHMPSSFAY